MQKIIPCLWFETQAEDAAQFYCSLFNHSKTGRIAYFEEAAAEVSGQKKGSVLTVEFELLGQKMMGLNGGPNYKHTPSFSLFVWCETEKEIDALWKELSQNGKVRMGLEKYPWSEKYGWTADRYGVEWQLMLSGQKQKIAPAFMFVNDLFGKGEEAIHYYLSLFQNSKINTMARSEDLKSVLHCTFSLAGQDFALMEGPGEHEYAFSPAFSLMVNCNTQAEIDDYWEKLSAGGTIEECGWLRDKYGVSWQIVPSILSDMMVDPKKSNNVMKAVIQMKKLDISKIQQAYEQG